MAVKFVKVGDTWKPVRGTMKKGKRVGGKGKGEEGFNPIPKLVRDELIANPTKSVDELLPMLRKKFPDSKQVCNRASWMRKLRRDLLKAGKVKAVKEIEPAVPKAKAKAKSVAKKSPTKKVVAKKSTHVTTAGVGILNRPVS